MYATTSLSLRSPLGLLHVLCLDSLDFVPLCNFSGQFVDIRAWGPLAARDERGTVAEKFVHILKVEALGLRLEAPEEDGICQVADNEDEIEFLDVRGQQRRAGEVNLLEHSPSQLKRWR